MTPASPCPAATVLLLRDGATAPEVFMVRRHPAIAFMGGEHVFPGGSVEDADQGADARWCDGVEHARRQLAHLSSRDALAVRVAAVRELFEEAGVLLARDRSGGLLSPAGAARSRLDTHREHLLADGRGFRAILERDELRPALDLLIPCARWVTPAHLPRRFDTYFFAARMPRGQFASHDGRETVESGWLAPAEAIRSARAREILLPAPTWAMIGEIEPFRSVDEILASCATWPIERREPEPVEGDGARTLRVPGSDIRFIWDDGRWRPERT